MPREKTASCAVLRNFVVNWASLYVRLFSGKDVVEKELEKWQRKDIFHLI